MNFILQKWRIDGVFPNTFHVFSSVGLKYLIAFYYLILIPSLDSLIIVSNNIFRKIKKKEGNTLGMKYALICVHYSKFLGLENQKYLV